MKAKQLKAILDAMTNEELDTKEIDVEPLSHELLHQLPAQFQAECLEKCLLDNPSQTVIFRFK